MSEDDLRAAERRWRESGVPRDEAGYFLARIRAGQFPFLSGLAQETALVLLHRLAEAGLTGELIQRMLENPELLERIMRVVRDERAPQTDELAGERLEELGRTLIAELPVEDEVVDSNFTYPEGFRIRSIEEQLATWSELLPDLDQTYAEQRVVQPIPEGSEGWGVIPKPSVLGGYQVAFERVLAIIAEQQDFYNFLYSRAFCSEIQLVAETDAWLDRQESEQPGDYLVFPFQFGLRHRGRSVRCARAYFAPDEVGLGPCEVASLLVTHPDRVTGYRQLGGISCPGCEFHPETSSVIQSVAFRWGGSLVFADWFFDGPHEEWGAATAFIP